MVYHFYAEFRVSDSEIHQFSGVVTSDRTIQSTADYVLLKADIAANMTPPRESEGVMLKSLTLVSQ